MKKENNLKKRLISTVTFVIYCAILIKVMVFKSVPDTKSGQLSLNFGGTNGGHPANLLPFATIWPYLRGDKGLTIDFLNLAGNIVLLVPLGFLLPLVYRKMT